jgi:hypothetical protein
MEINNFIEKATETQYFNFFLKKHLTLPLGEAFIMMTKMKNKTRRYLMIINNLFMKSFCGGSRGKRKKLRRLEGKKLRRLKASIHLSYANSHELSSIRHINSFSAALIHLKKPSGGPKGLIGPPCHGAPGRRRHWRLEYETSFMVYLGGKK